MAEQHCRHDRLNCSQEVALAACQSATRTQQGCIRLSEGGLEAVAHDVAVLEVRLAGWAVPQIAGAEQHLAT